MQWAATGRPLLSWRNLLCRFIFAGGHHKVLKLNINPVIYEKIAILSLGSPCKLNLFFRARTFILITHQPLVDKPNMNEICPTIQGVFKVHTHIKSIPKTTSLYSGVLKTFCVTILSLIFVIYSTSPYYIHEKRWKASIFTTDKPIL